MSRPLPDFADVMGQENVKRALEVAAAGGHNVLLVGSPGAGKSMLARRLPSILPDMTRVEALQTTEVYSVAGMTDPSHPLVTRRPFRSPHHTASTVSLSGGGTVPRPAGRFPWPTTAYCFWMSCRSLTKPPWRPFASLWRMVWSPSPGPQAP